MSKVGNKFGSSSSSMSKVGSKFGSSGSSSSTSKVGSKFGSSGSTSPVRTSSSPVRMSSSGTRKASSGGNFFTILLVIILVVMIALLSVSLNVLIVLFIVSVVGIGISFVISKPEITPEDRLRESTINEFQVPNTKAAIMEFTLLATQKIQPVSPVKAMFDLEAKRQQWLNKVWTEKCQGIYNRATVAMQGDAGSLNTITQLMTKAGVKV